MDKFCLKTQHKSVQIDLDCIDHPQMVSTLSPYHVHPSPCAVKLQRAFQQQDDAKALKGLDMRAPIVGRALCLSARGSPGVSHLSEGFRESVSLTSVTDIDALATKIGAMFPTVDYTHIKMLLNKYHNREAVVVSALQVEKHPIVTPGPLTSMTTLQREPLMGTLTFRGSGGLVKVASINDNKEKRSPNIKIRYMKSIFPKADETLILDILSNNDNNVQKATENLLTMGFTKKDKTTQQQQTAKKEKAEEKMVTTVVSLTNEDKESIILRMQEKFPFVEWTVISMALDSVNYDETKAATILKDSLDTKSTNDKPETGIDGRHLEERRSSRIQTDIRNLECLVVEEMIPVVRKETPSTSRRHKCRNVHFKSNEKINSTVDDDRKGNSIYVNQMDNNKIIMRKGPDLSLRRGPDDNLLLAEYVPWLGPNPDLRCGRTVTVRSSQVINNSQRVKAKGPAGIAKGSIYRDKYLKLTLNNQSCFT